MHASTVHRVLRRQGLHQLRAFDRPTGRVIRRIHTNRPDELVHIDAEEFYRMLEGVVIDDTELFNDKLQEWENFYNYHRPHGGLDGQTPYERLRQRTAIPA
jgi:transposase InsO family protein